LLVVLKQRKIGIPKSFTDNGTITTVEGFAITYLPPLDPF